VSYKTPTEKEKGVYFTMGKVKGFYRSSIRYCILMLDIFHQLVRLCRDRTSELQFFINDCGNSVPSEVGLFL
jgi:hypothetical protein